MQIEIEDYLKLVEGAGTLAAMDIEASGLRGDYNQIVVVSFKPFGKKPYSLAVKQVGDDSKLMKEVLVEMEKYDCLVTYFGKGFDLKMIQARLLRWELPRTPKHHHLDLYYSLKSKILTARKSLAHLGGWLKLPEDKQSVSAEDWASMPATWDKPDENGVTTKAVMIKRCESDTILTENLYNRTKHLYDMIVKAG